MRNNARGLVLYGGKNTSGSTAISPPMIRFSRPPRISLGAGSDARTRQAKAHAEGKKSAADFHDLNDLAEVLRVKVEALLNISPELIVEVCGLWIWVTGETRKHHTAIKAVEGLRYALPSEVSYNPTPQPTGFRISFHENPTR
jgi:hypothetical protein